MEKCRELWASGNYGQGGIFISVAILLLPLSCMETTKNQREYIFLLTEDTTEESYITCAQAFINFRKVRLATEQLPHSDEGQFSKRKYSDKFQQINLDRLPIDKSRPQVRAC